MNGRLRALAARLHRAVIWDGAPQPVTYTAACQHVACPDHLCLLSTQPRCWEDEVTR